MPLTISKKEKFLFSFHCNEFSKLRLNFGRHFAIPLIFKQEHFVMLCGTYGGGWQQNLFPVLQEACQRNLGNYGLEFMEGEMGFGEGAHGNSIQDV